MRCTAQGAALAVVLVLLTGLAALALAAAAAAITALAVAGHQQSTAHAFEAAEAGIAHALLQARARPGLATAGPFLHSGGVRIDAYYRSRTIAQAGIGSLPPGFSVGDPDTGFASQHYLIVADGEANRAARVTLEQGFYVVVPGS